MEDGSFCVRDKKKRRGRNPQTGEDKMLDARRVVVFRCSGRGICRVRICVRKTFQNLLKCGKSTKIVKIKFNDFN
jgi:hypothetical protein